MAIVGELLVLIGANNSALTAGLAKSSAELKTFQGEAAATSATAGMALAAIGVGAAVIGIAAIKSASTFEDAMILIETQAGASRAEVEAMIPAVLALATQTGTGPQTLAEGLYHIESAGLRGAQALDVLTAAAQGAKVGHADLESVTNALIASVNSGVSGVGTMSGAMGTLNAIVGSGNMRMEDLTAAFTTGILSSAATFGVSIQSVGAALATMTNAGLPAEQSATRLRMTLSLLGAPTDKATKELKKIGLSSIDLGLALRGPDGILGATQMLSDHLNSLTFDQVVQMSGKSAGYVTKHWQDVLDATKADIISSAFGGGRSSGAIMALLGSLEKFGLIQKQVNEGAGKFGDAWATTLALMSTQADVTGSSLETVVDSIGLGLIPMVTNLLTSINPAIASFAQWASVNQDMIAKVLLVVGAVGALAAVGLALGAILGIIGTAIAVITSPILIIGAAIVGLAAYFGLLGDGAKGAVDGILGTLGQLAGPAIATLNTLAGQFVTWISAQVPVWIGQLGRWAAAFVDWIAPMIPRALGMLGQLASQAIAWVIARAPSFLAALLRWAQSFMDWVAPMIPKVLMALGQLGAALIVWILGQLPKIGIALGKLAVQFVSWVVPMIPVLLGALLQLGLALIGWIIKQIDTIEISLRRWAKAMVDWIAQSAPGLAAALGLWISQLVALIGTAAGQLAAAGLKMGQQLVAGIMAGIGDIAKMVGDKLNEIPGVSLVGRVAQEVIPHYAEGGVIPGTGPVPIIAHGGETVMTPAQRAAFGAVGAGSSSQPVAVTHHTHLHIGEREIADMVEQLLFNAASGSSSGFAGSPVTS